MTAGTTVVTPRLRRLPRAVVWLAQLLPAIVWSALIAVPMAFLVIISFRTNAEFIRSPLALPAALNFDNFSAAWVRGNLPVAFANTATITVMSVIGIVIFGSAAAHAIVRWGGSGGNRLYVYFALGLIVPFQLGLPALYKMWAQLGLVNTLPGVILIQIGAGLPLAIFLYAGFLRTVPIDLEESARLDGAGDIRTFVSIVFPLLRPATATVVILSSIGIWNDLLISLYFLQSPATQTLPKATLGFQSLYSNDIPVIFACAVLTVIPIIAVFVFLQRYFVAGLSAGALKG